MKVVSISLPSSLGMTDLSGKVPSEPLLLPEPLKQRGYATRAVVSHGFVGVRYGFDQGFDEFVEVGVETGSSARVTEAALRLVDGVSREACFLMVHYADPRPPWSAPEGFGRVGSGRYTGPVRAGVSLRELMRAAREFTPEDRAEMKRLYGAEVAWTDHQLGRLFDGLRTRGRFEDAVVVLVGSHGFELLDHGAVGDAATLYEYCSPDLRSRGRRCRSSRRR